MLLTIGFSLTTATHDLSTRPSVHNGGAAAAGPAVSTNVPAAAVITATAPGQRCKPPIHDLLTFLWLGNSPGFGDTRIVVTGRLNKSAIAGKFQAHRAKIRDFRDCHGVLVTGAV